MWLRALYVLVAVLLVIVVVQFVALQRAGQPGNNNGMPPPQTVTAEDAAVTLPGLTFGPEDADVTVIEFLDYRCPACRAAHPVVQQALAEFPDVRFVFRHIPVFGKDSVNEAQVAITAARYDRFMDAHQRLMALEEPAGEEGINRIIAELGFDVQSFRTEMRQPGNADIFLKTIDAAETLGITATPAFVVNGTVFESVAAPLTIHDLRRLIAAARGQTYDMPDATPDAAPAE